MEGDRKALKVAQKAIASNTPGMINFLSSVKEEAGLRDFGIKDYELVFEGRFVNALTGLDARTAALNAKIGEVVQPWDRRAFMKKLSVQLSASEDCKAEILRVGKNIINRVITGGERYGIPLTLKLITELETAFTKGKRDLVVSTSAPGTEDNS